MVSSPFGRLIHEQMMTHFSGGLRSILTTAQSGGGKFQGRLNQSIRPIPGIRPGVPILLICCALLSVAGCSNSDSFLSLFSSRLVPAGPAPVPIPNPYPIEITGSSYHWNVRYPGFDGLLGTPDDIHGARDIHVPAEREIIFELRSKDYVYLFSIPDLKLKEAAVPTLEFRLTFHASQTGEWKLTGDEFCGEPHPELNGRIIVESHDQFQKWLTDANR